LAARHFRALVWPVLLAAAGYLGFALWSGWRDVASAFAKVGILGIAVALSLSLTNYSLRFIRWQAYLRAMDHPVPWWPSLKIYLAGFALTATPGKAGEAVRGVLLRRWGVPYPMSFAAFLSERLSDLLAVVLLTLFGLTLYPAAQPLVALGAAGVLAAFMLISSQRLLERWQQAIRGTTRFASLLRHLIQTLLQARRCQSPMMLAGATALSLAAWIAEAWAFYLVCRWMGLEVPATLAVFIFALAMLAGALSFVPGGLGGTEAVMIGLLLWTGASGADAVAATLLIRVTTLWFAVGVGIGVLANQSRR
jgi:uncharacterized protein (TIRG00374 family)